MTADRKIVLHVGYPKAASTWLQTKVFTTENGFQNPWPPHENEALEQFVWRNKSDFAPSDARSAFLSKGAEQSAAAVMSHEVLVGDPVRGRYNGFETADRLASAFPDACVVIFFRAQHRYAYSAWCEHIKRGGVTSLDEFLSSDDVPHGYRAFCPIEFLRFDAMIRYYRELFSAERVLALPLEAIPSGRASSELAMFLDEPRLETVDLGVSYAGMRSSAIHAIRQLNRFFPYDPTQRRSRKFVSQQANRIHRRWPKSAHDRRRAADEKQVAEFLSGRFSASNQRLQRFTPVDLSEFDYELD
ncbi:MAG: hypothetical protein AAGC77_11490 [Pseudomonadota bacterium]